MLLQRFLRSSRSMINRRFISQSTIKLDTKTTSSANKPPSTESSAPSEANEISSLAGARTVIPNDFDKWILVWMKKYPKGQVPNRVREEVIYQTKSRARIKAANYMMAFAIVMCIVAAYNGKQEAKSGETLAKRNLEWHKKNKEEYEAQLKVESQQS